MSSYVCINEELIGPIQVLGNRSRPKGTTTWNVQFTLIPADRVDSGDNTLYRITKEVEVFVKIGISLQVSSTEHASDAIRRAVVWKARQALERGENTVILDSKTAIPDVDLSQLSIDEPFELELPCPDVALHARR